MCPSAAAPQSDADVSSAGNPTIAPLSWAGYLLNTDVIVKDGKKYSKACTGQFISPRVILTAAHCVEDDAAGFYDLDKMYFLLQYQNKEFSQSYRPICLSRFDQWRPPALQDRQATEVERNRAEQARYQWDYAMILLDRPSATGYYKHWIVDARQKYPGATATGYPLAMLGGQIIQKAYGTFDSALVDKPAVVALRHNHLGLTTGSSGGAWVANFSKEDGSQYNIIISITSFVKTDKASGAPIVPYQGVSFGPSLTPDFSRLFDYVSNGCSGGRQQTYTARLGDKQVTAVRRELTRDLGLGREELLRDATDAAPVNPLSIGQ
jgi:hypothetical protein